MGTPSSTATSACCIGAGRMGRAILRAAERADIRVLGSWSRSSAGPLEQAVVDADLVFVAVPDDAVASVVERLDRLGLDGRLVLVTSGAARIDRLAQSAPTLRLARLHPMQAAGRDAPEGLLDGAVAAVTADDEGVRDAAAQVARRLGMRPFELDDEHAATWHAAGTLAAGGVVATLAAARDLAVRAGLEPAAALHAVAALAAAAIDQARASSPERAITGPVARGDDATVAMHRAAIGHVEPELLELYDALASRAAEVAGQAPRAGVSP